MRIKFIAIVIIFANNVGGSNRVSTEFRHQLSENYMDLS